MEQREIIRMVRKLSKRRHNATTQLATALMFPLGQKEQIRELRANISDLNSEIASLLERI